MIQVGRAAPPRPSPHSFFNTRTRIRTLAAALLVAGCTLAGDAPRAVDRGSYSMQVLVNGRPLEELAARGTTYVEAIEGAEYTIRLSNRTGERVAIALSVDGLNSIDAKTTDARSARKWILGPWQTLDLDGWQTSSSTARRFFFTSERESYGAWLGKTKNLGILSAAVFREKRTVAELERQERDRSDAAGAPAAPSARQSKESAAGDSRTAAKTARLSDELAATGIGRELDHHVRQVSFDAEDRPAAVLDVRYEYHDALVKLGVLPRYTDEGALSRRERSSGFEEPLYAPDPYRRRNR